MCLNINIKRILANKDGRRFPFTLNRIVDQVDVKIKDRLYGNYDLTCLGTSKFGKQSKNSRNEIEKIELQESRGMPGWKTHVHLDLVYGRVGLVASEINLKVQAVSRL